MYEFDGFHWYEGKRAIVLVKHGFDIAIDGPQTMSDPYAKTFFSPKNGEERYKTIGIFKGKIHAVVHTPRSGKCWIITMRRAHKDEEEAYYER